MGSIFTAIGNVASAFAEGCKLAYARLTLKNTPAMQNNAQAAQDQGNKDRITSEIASGDVKAVSDELST